MADRPAGASVAGLAAARVAAGRTRARWLTRLACGQVGLLDVLRAATLPGGEPLRGIRVKELLATQPGWGQARTGKALTRLRRSAGVPESVRDVRLSVAWLLDNRGARGRRLAYLLDALVADGHRRPPWPGFPYTAAPADFGGSP